MVMIMRIKVSVEGVGVVVGDEEGVRPESDEFSGEDVDDSGEGSDKGEEGQKHVLSPLGDFGGDDGQVGSAV
jgi:hypothetical protein